MMRRLVWLCLFFVASFASAADPAGWTVRGHVPRDRFVVQAHRGAGELAEENTPEAFELGWKLGCIPEADVRTTKDGVIVAFHDANFARVVRGIDPAKAKQGVKDVTFAELQRMDVGSWKGDAFSGRRVARMSDIFALLERDSSRRLYLDIKQVDLDQLAAEVQQHHVARQVILASTVYDNLRRWKRLLPDSNTLLWMGGTEAKLEQRFEELRQTGFADITQLQIHTHLKGPAEEIRRDSVDPFQESDAFLRAKGEEVRRHGIVYQTLPWGGSTKEIYWKLLDLGFMSFATDHPEVTQQAVGEYYDKG